MSPTMQLCGVFISVILAVTAPRAIIADCPEADPERHQEGNLHHDLLSCGYNPDYRPVKDHNTPVTVKIRFALKYISFDSLEETVTLHSWVAMSWKDEYLKWTPSDYGGIKEIQVESHEIWTPRMALFNADASLYQSDSIYTTCLVTEEGTVTCVPQMAHSGICRTYLRSWPFDVQNCSLYFGSWMHKGEQINFTFYKTKPVIVDDYQDGPGWKLINTAHERLPGAYGCCPNSTYPMLKYTFTLKREAAGPAAIVVVPSVVIVLITLISLLLDIKDCTRLLLLCFSLYGHFMFLTEIGFDIPKHSSDTPIILLFVRDSMIINLAAILVTLLLMSFRRKVVAAPVWIASFNRLLQSGPARYVVFTEFDPSETTEVKVLTEDNTNEEKTNVNADWIHLANFLNSCVFIIAIIAYFVLVCTYIPRDDY
ncbi:unnamed protein product [Leptidea sinapis]|uniref:Neurotransmitter-gated ion-channel ligand-binding domain-containing protein n=1 Tax=Leptidea sinapis TaxID=189913 RepID=A0A5E4Q481_9NEOP|nr:unnamed protein product [Leptidea sinapis]